MKALRYFRRRLASFRRAKPPEAQPAATEQTPAAKPKPDWILAAERVYAEGDARRKRIQDICEARKREAELLKGGRLVTTDSDSSLVRSKEVH